MKIRTIAAAAAAVVSLATAPAIAEVSYARASAPVEGESEIGGGMLVAALVLAGIIAGIVIAAGDDNKPVSP
ncbi:hypothetical protein [Altererythrobacter litoralis]|uniref:Ferrochelatase n=1 Tax=Altererythrobacter litoralis TaxID=3113904 RepID=A0ABU7GE44_9SPHN|nr:hypothetical protein [Erythrobacteraceae bacterium 1XM1-14]